MMVAFPNVGVVKAEEPIYIRADGSVEGTDKIQRDGTLYTFLGNISIDGSGIDGIIVERDNIVIDGANFALQDESQTETLNKGIFLNQRNNVTVKNTQIMDFNVGIQITDSSNNFIENNQLLENKRGIDLYLSNDNKIFNNTFLNNYQYAILLRRTGPVSLSTSPRGNTVSNNTLQYNNHGINFEGGNIIKGNILYKNTGTAIEVNSYVTVTDNIATENEIGIDVSGRDNVLKGNIMDYNSKFNFFMSGLHPDYYHTKDVSILVNDIDTSNTVNGDPIYYWIDKHNKIVPQNAGYIILVNCNNITVENQQLKSNGEGIVLLNTINSKVIRNTLQENNIGLGVFLSSQNLISQNNIVKNDIGIRIDDSFNNNITLNGIIQNNDWGIDFKGSQKNNYIYRNNFISNGNGETLQVSMDKKFGSGLENFWSPNNIGNYWSDYLERYPTATEIDGTSVGDRPFYINENNIDHYPILKPFIIPEFPSWTPLLITSVAVVTVAVIYRRRLIKQNQGGGKQ
jgi:parallel beta-helix repeat protein